jgi:hypothetical protein
MFMSAEWFNDPHVQAAIERNHHFRNVWELELEHWDSIKNLLSNSPDPLGIDSALKREEARKMGVPFEFIFPMPCEWGEEVFEAFRKMENTLDENP